MSSKHPVDVISISSDESPSNSNENPKPNPVPKKSKNKGNNDDEASSSNPKQTMSPESSEDPNPWIPMQPPERELVSPFLFTDSDEDRPPTPDGAPSTPTAETSWKPATFMDDSDEDSKEDK